ncbi:MAG TPA: His/Gly/Thr/Pro-type tRNA ligase C-terminal domain-containing protein, partial [Planctomycetota bacterium]|nr:His/Gly/Thr/Pro-type tRNA ligase C-terminal domain-containing protein [Planctomycetota bacterium]
EEELASRVYLRPETAQGIFMNFKNVLDSSRRKLPFGIAQIGKAFRNEITPGNFTFRTREFEQMELEFFIKPPQFLREGEKTDEQWHAEWVDARYRWWISLGIDTSRLRKRAQDKSELAHYAKATTDLEYLFPGSLGWGEVEGVANRTDFDLSAHSREVPEADLKRLKLEANKDSVTTLDYFDTEAKARYIPWVIEPSAGATRAALTFLCEAYHEEMVKEPPQAEIEALKTEIDAVIKNADKKKKDAEKEKDPAQRKHDPVAISAFQAALAEAASRLPASLMEIDTMLEDHAGAQNLEPVKKLKPKVNKLAEDCVRVVLKLHPKLAPVKVAVFPLARNKPELVDIAQRVSRELRHFCKAIYDDSAGIGKLYRRQDEIGTPLCVTVDHQTLEDNMVTVRDRDTMDQVRISLEQLPHEIRRRLQLH